ncbi:flavin reductase family protein [Halorubrum vacuolatum]|uniref:NADH-FMN oxidoreductase RutF, flavin reductase (DIM6/NTAB) family n=1 Tax=Halorubrum vacuolatum TaxID=63740 RepID=A0A238VEL0_HALVU|nr:flavin reductase family protein [Halorubrum vacuolatum]SNR31969.1 NADH-FMN oxidoreductase RutF, flavin reductase (DIM6/NTAB) family [Halorubrum vacuolatum]
MRSGDPDAFGSPYRLLSTAVTPRPIAWVSSRGPAGENLAPYSFYTVAAVDPPTLLFAPVATAAAPKDTLANAVATEAFVVNVVTRDLVEEMNASSATLEPEESEFDHAGVTPVEAVHVDAPRVAEASVSMECHLTEAIEIGGSTVVVGEVVYAHVDDDVLADGKIDIDRLETVGRLAGNRYASTEDRFTIERPP